MIETYTRAIADALDVRGLINVQYAVKQGQVFVIEANPRASRTVPFVAKATGVPLAKVAARVMVGRHARRSFERRACSRPPVDGGHVSVKEAVLPFNRFPEVDTILGPEMRSTGEVMGIDVTVGLAFAKSQNAAGNTLPDHGRGIRVAHRPRQGGRARHRTRAGGPRLRDRGHRGDGAGISKPTASGWARSWASSATPTGAPTRSS